METSARENGLMSDFVYVPGLPSQEGDCPFEPGDVVQDSGIYAICHSDGKRHTVVFLRGSQFPDCDCCGSDVRYRLVRAAPYIFEDTDFSPPAGSQEK